jgi:hypothetical protein
MINLILSLLLWLAFNAIMGIIEGSYWHFRNIVVDTPTIKKSVREQLFNLHSFLFQLRILIASLILLNNLSCFVALGLILTQPFFHLWCMYAQRNYLNPKTYLKRFFDVNVTGDGDTSFYDRTFKQINFRMRLLYFVAGCVIYFL